MLYLGQFKRFDKPLRGYKLCYRVTYVEIKVIP